MLHGLNTFCDAYLDDMTIFSVSWSDHMYHLKHGLQRVSDSDLTFNLSNCVFANADRDILGHHIGLHAFQLKIQKVIVLLRFPQPTNKKRVSVFSGVG